MKYRVIKNYTDTPKNPISIIKGESLKFVKESDANGDWPNWIFCTGNNKEGWVPKQILINEGENLIAAQDYSAAEHILTVGEIIISEQELNGWIWGKKVSSDIYGWAPLNHLEKMKIE